MGPTESSRALGEGSRPPLVGILPAPAQHHQVAICSVYGVQAGSGRGRGHDGALVARHLAAAAGRLTARPGTPGPRRSRGRGQPPRAATHQRGKMEPCGRELCRQFSGPESRFHGGPTGAAIPTPNPLRIASFRVHPRKKARARSATAMVANSACSAFEKNDSTMRWASPTGRVRSRSTPSSRPRQGGDHGHFRRMRDVEPKSRPAVGRSNGIQLGFASGHRPEPERARRLIEQSSQDLAQGRAATDKPPAVARSDKPGRTHPLFVVERRDLRTRLGPVDLRLDLEPGIELHEPDTDFIQRQCGWLAAGLPCPQNGARECLALGRRYTIGWIH